MTAKPRISEATVLDTWPMLSPAELKRARKHGRITWYDFRTGPHYLESDVEEYVERTYKRCAGAKTLSGNLPATTSRVPIQAEEMATTPADITPELAQSVAKASTQRILNMRSKNSSRSSPQRRPEPKMLETQEAS